MTQRRPRLYDPGYLAWLRKRPCIICQKPGPSDPAHIRFGSAVYGKRDTGAGEKPDDRWAIPMCRKHHSEQHSMNENDFWFYAMVDPLFCAKSYYAEYGGTGGKPRRRTTIKPRLPKETRAKINSRGFGPQKRGFK